MPAWKFVPYWSCRASWGIIRNNQYSNLWRYLFGLLLSLIWELTSRVSSYFYTKRWRIREEATGELQEFIGHSERNDAITDLTHLWGVYTVTTATACIRKLIRSPTDGDLRRFEFTAHKNVRILSCVTGHSGLHFSFCVLVPVFGCPGDHGKGKAGGLASSRLSALE